jgi:hypothetical protein
MQIGTSIFLIAVGAIMKYAITADTDGFNIETAGLILMVVGAIGLVISLFMATIYRPRTAERPVVRDRV